MAEEKDKINFAAIEKKWQDKWEKEKAFVVKENSKKKKFYVLEMFPYPSGGGLHMGHAFNYIIGDIYARTKRMHGFNVLYPMGYDSLGLPAENAAIKNKTHPKKYTEDSIKNFIKQQKGLGLSYDWTRMVVTGEPDYYKWDQWIFLKMFEKKLAFRKKAAVNFCPKCNTVLANEQVHDGKCWRHTDTSAEIKHLEQWFFKITDYAEELYDSIDSLKGWPERIKAMQKNWIGKSYGTEIDFEINNEKWPIFTTRPDTIFGVTFMVVSSQHSRLMELVTQKQKKEVEGFLKKIKSTSEKDIDELEKEGVFTGSFALNPMTNEKVPVYAGNFVVADYGCGMVMAVPAHDSRDFEFAVKYKIPIKQVIKPVYGEKHDKEEFRKSISAVVHRKQDNKFLILKWKEFNWCSPVVGGIEDGENILKAAEREVLEETGYKVKAVKLLGGEIESHFFADNKRVFRHRIDQPVLLEIIEDKQKKIESEEANKHEAVWMTEDEALKNITHEYNKLGILRYLGKESAYTDSGILVNSGKFNGIESEIAKEEIAKELARNKVGRKTVNYKLRDWLISRQRYWGTPIPIIYCDKCGIVPVPEKDLPVELPEKVKFGEGNPLETSKSWLEAECPKCGGKGKRETDTMDTFVNSSWYFLRYCDSKNLKEIFDKKKVGYWMPIDRYIGGAEHACMHLIYFRFYTKFLRDLGLIKFDEPTLNLFNQGMLHGSDGAVMSKSRGNIVLPEEISKIYGIDTARLFLMSIASPDKDILWSDEGIQGSSRFIKKVMDYFLSFKAGKSSEKFESKLHKTIKEVTEDIENFKYNIAVIKIRELFDNISETQISKNDAESFLKLLSPFCPHITEELWSKIGGKGFVSLALWPIANEKKINEKLEQQERQVEKLCGDILNIMRIIKDRDNKEMKKAYVYVIPNELDVYKNNLELINKKTGLEIIIFAVNDKNKYDIKGISKKSKPGKPGIYLE